MRGERTAASEINELRKQLLSEALSDSAVEAFRQRAEKAEAACAEWRNRYNELAYTMPNDKRGWLPPDVGRKLVEDATNYMHEVEDAGGEKCWCVAESIDTPFVGPCMACVLRTTIAAAEPYVKENEHGTDR